MESHVSHERQQSQPVGELVKKEALILPCKGGPATQKVLLLKGRYSVILPAWGSRVKSQDIPTLSIGGPAVTSCIHTSTSMETSAANTAP